MHVEEDRWISELEKKKNSQSAVLEILENWDVIFNGSSIFSRFADGSLC